MENKDRIEKALERYGIHNRQELEKALAKQERLKIGIFADPVRERHEKDIADMGGARCIRPMPA